MWRTNWSILPSFRPDVFKNQLEFVPNHLHLQREEKKWPNCVHKTKNHRQSSQVGSFKAWKFRCTCHYCHMPVVTFQCQGGWGEVYLQDLRSRLVQVCHQPLSLSTRLEGVTAVTALVLSPSQCQPAAWQGSVLAGGRAGSDWGAAVLGPAAGRDLRHSCDDASATCGAPTHHNCLYTTTPQFHNQRGKSPQSQSKGAKSGADTTVCTGLTPCTLNTFWTTFGPFLNPQLNSNCSTIFRLFIFRYFHSFSNMFLDNIFNTNQMTVIDSNVPFRTFWSNFILGHTTWGIQNLNFFDFKTNVLYLFSSPHAIWMMTMKHTILIRHINLKFNKRSIFFLNSCGF